MKSREKRGWGSLVAAALGGAAVTAVLLASPVIGDDANRRPEPEKPLIAPARPATAGEVAAAGIDSAAISAAKKATEKTSSSRKLTYTSMITGAIPTEESKGSFVGIKCPAGTKAIAGGIAHNKINLLLSASSPIRPDTLKFTPRIWWVSVTNSDIDGIGGTLTWRGVATCMGPVKLVKQSGKPKS